MRTCTEKNCIKKHHAKGLCSSHYCLKWQRDNSVRFNARQKLFREKVGRAYFAKKSREKRSGWDGREHKGSCEACKQPFKRIKRDPANADHEHSTGKFRGWLCNSCNRLEHLMARIRSGQDEQVKKIDTYLERFRLGILHE